MEKREKVELLQWLLDFTYLDLDRMEVGELAKLSSTLEMLINGGIWGQGRLSMTFDEAANTLGRVSFDEKRLNTMRSVQSGFKGCVEYAMAELDLRNAEEGKWRKWQEATPIADLASMKIRPLVKPISMQISVSASVSLCVEAKQNDQGNVFLRAVPEWRSESSFRSISSAGRDEDMLTLIFLGAIDGLSVDIFRRCKECLHWYVHSSRRARLYCSNLCAARSANRARRSRDKAIRPEEYERELAAGAKRARRSYVRKIQSHVGKVKVESRPRKYKAQVN
jgi:hypothetical protein